MLIEVGIMGAVYMGTRFYEKYHKTKKVNINKKIKSKRVNTIKLIESSKPVKSSQIEMRKERRVNDTTKQCQHYYKISAISTGVSILRQFFYPSLGLFSLILYIYTVIPHLKSVEKSVKEKQINVDILFFIGEATMLALSQYFAAALSIFLSHRGRMTVAEAKDQSEKMLVNIFEQQPRNVWLFKDNVEIEVPLETVKKNDVLVVNTSEVIPVDGLIIEGAATIDQHALTGESQPIEKEIGEQVFAATVIITGKIYIKVEKSGQETTVSKIGQILTQSTDFKTNVQLKGEEWANKAVLPMLGISAIILPIIGPASTVVFIASHIGYRIRMLAPLVTLNHISLASHSGILVKDGRALEMLADVDTVLFDKTGTLTDECPEIRQIILCDDYQENEILTYAAAAERKFTHPIAKAILKQADAFNLTLPEIDDSKYQIGYGITVNIDNKIIRVGSTRFMAKEEITIPERIKTAQDHSHSNGYSLVLVAIDNQVSGAIEIHPKVRSEVTEIISGLRQRGIKHIAIVSGDHQQPTQKLAAELGMDNYFYGVLPEDKAKIVEQLQQQGKSVCFVGDGINDTIAMKKANVSISLRGATSIATDMAEIVLMDGSLSHLGTLFDISKSLETNLQSSLMLTFVPGVINLSGAFIFHFQILTSLLVTGTFTTVGIIKAKHSLTTIEQTEKS
jgi:heavy metal translocating P-type ATPase